MSYERCLLDIETQQDFFASSGSCYKPQAAEAAVAVYRLFDWARKNEIPVISTVLRVRPCDHGPLSPTPHCIDGSDGERKMPRTILPRRVNLGLINTTDLPSQLFQKYQQVIFEKRDTDLFAHARAERLITEMPRTTFVICGAGVAHGIAQAAVGLASRGLGVVVASDAILDLDHPLAGMARLRMAAKGAVFAPSSEIVKPTPQPRAKPFRRAAFQLDADVLALLRTGDDDDDDEDMPGR